ncbi:MAG: SpoIVB peptidase [Thermaerobacter sp.]|nr:SpoIVB peptidase [Thermaerobacter sp.]
MARGQHDRGRQGWRRKAAGLAGAVAVVAIGFSSPVDRWMALPSPIEVPAGQEVAFAWSPWLPWPTASSAQCRPLLTGHGSRLTLLATGAGYCRLPLRWFGWLPWRSLPVKVTKPVDVIPGGESVGVLVHTRGLLVTGFSPVEASVGRRDPAETAGIQRGDIIVRIGRRTAGSGNGLRQAVNRAGHRHRPVELTTVSGKRRQTWPVWPVWSPRTHRYQIGLRTEDRASGVGTLTFYFPSSGRYAALGHSLTDGLTRQPAAVLGGQILGAAIVGIVDGTANHPGQKVGVLAGSRNIAGSVRHNGEFGIVGRLRHPPFLGPARPVPIALPDQVRPGPARILTVLKGQQPQAFAIDILAATRQTAPETKGLLFKVTDPRLLAKTGGVVQGMSGSPILQDGRLVGAVTHVLVGRPSLGFGCYAYWMVSQSALSDPSPGD